MKQKEFQNIFTNAFKSFTSRMWIDYLDENKNPFAKSADYAGYVIENFKYLVKKFNKEQT